MIIIKDDIENWITIALFPPRPCAGPKENHFIDINY